MRTYVCFVELYIYETGSVDTNGFVDTKSDPSV